MDKIEIYGSQILRAENQNITEFDEGLNIFVEQMKHMMHHASGIGLAAPQAGRNLSLFITEAPGDEVRVFINPKIVSTSVDEVEMEEGCLSIPGIYGEVTRPRKVVVEAQGIDGSAFRIKADGMLSRVIQHEYDHLKGVLFTDYLDEKLQKKADKKFLHKKKSGVLRRRNNRNQEAL